MLLDEDASGYIQVHDFITCLRTLGLRFDDETATKSFRAIDQDGDGHITLSEFSSWFSFSFDAQQPRHDLSTRLTRFMSRAKRRLRRHALDEARARTYAVTQTLEHKYSNTNTRIQVRHLRAEQDVTKL